MDKYLKELEADPDYKGQPPKPSVFLVGDIETIPLLDRNYVPAEIIESKIFSFFFSWRLCIYYRCLNAMTVVSKYPVPIVEELLDVWCLMVF